MPNTYGLTSLTFGVPATLTGYVIQSFAISNKNAINAEVFNETGERVAVRYDDLTTEVSFDAVINGATLPVPGAVFTYNSILYETLSVDVKQANKAFNVVTIKGKTSANITLS